MVGVAKRVEITEQQKAAIDLYVLDIYARKTKTHKSYIAEKVGAKADTVQNWFRTDEPFKAALATELSRHKDNYNDLPLALRRTRVARLSDLYDTIEDKRVDLKLKVLREIREEVGDHKVQVEVQHKGDINVNIPPRPETYEEWLKQNSLASKAVEAAFTEESA